MKKLVCILLVALLALTAGCGGVGKHHAEIAVKDYGTIIAGHGGIMDRFDGVLMTSILFLLISGFVNYFS
jgi:CDP-diglyceride synthetase